uniref:hypothetical protein n=1 Tax=Bordetella sputigena TaxID=1416810 RepID=UPI0039F06B89
MSAGRRRLAPASKRFSPSAASWLTPTTRSSVASACRLLRFDIVDGVPSFRSGARPDERGDITIEITTAAAKSLNSLLSADPAYGDAADHFMQSGAMRVHGDLSKLGAWLQYVHDPIVARTI